MENKLKGGKADKMTIEKIAKKHNVDIEFLKKQVKAGIEVEKEHTDDPELQEEITLDHLYESPYYYIELKKMEKKLEAKEQTMADASGSFEAPLTTTILKKDIHKLHNYKFKPKTINEMDGIPAMAYDAPIGTAGPSSPMDKTKKKRKDPLALDEKGKTASITAASTDDMVATKKGFPRFGGPEAKFVEIDAKCKTYPYCNQGDDGDKFKFISEIHGMKEAIKSAAKKYGISVRQVEEIILKESSQISEALPVGIDFSPALKWGQKGDETKFLYHLTTIDSETKEPVPLDFKTTDEITFEKLKLLLKGNGVKFDEGKQPIKNDEKILNKPPEEDDDIYGSDDEFDSNDDIFANMK